MIKVSSLETNSNQRISWILNNQVAWMDQRKGTHTNIRGLIGWPEESCNIEVGLKMIFEGYSSINTLYYPLKWESGKGLKVILVNMWWLDNWWYKLGVLALRLPQLKQRIKSNSSLLNRILGNPFDWIYWILFFDTWVLDFKHIQNSINQTNKIRK